MTAAVVLSFLLGLWTGHFATMCILVRAAQKGRRWFGSRASCDAYTKHNKQNS